MCECVGLSVSFTQYESGKWCMRKNICKSKGHWLPVMLCQPPDDNWSSARGLLECCWVIVTYLWLLGHCHVKDWFDQWLPMEMPDFDWVHAKSWSVSECGQAICVVHSRINSFLLKYTVQNVACNDKLLTFLQFNGLTLHLKNAQTICFNISHFDSTGFVFLSSTSLFFTRSLSTGNTILLKEVMWF